MEKWTWLVTAAAGSGFDRFLVQIPVATMIFVRERDDRGGVPATSHFGQS